MFTLTRKNSKSKLLKLIVIIFLSILISNLIFSYFIFTEVIGPSMNPVLKDKDLILVLKNAYARSSPHFLDIIAIRALNEKDPPIIKRIIGLPNDKITIKNSELFINDKLIKEPYVKEKMVNSCDINIVIPKNYYFVMGDNRNSSMDSRDESIGLIKKNQIIGKGVISIIPLKRLYY